MRLDLLEILGDRHETSSTVLISQLPLDQWYVSVGQLPGRHHSRLMHNANKLKLLLDDDYSMRKRYAEKID